VLAFVAPSFGGFRPQRILGLRVRRVIVVASTGKVRFPKNSDADNEVVAKMAIDAARNPESVVAFAINKSPSKGKHTNLVEFYLSP
jgi:hypothetical protein